MIIDAHVYCFPPLDALAGHRSVREHLDVAQWGHARHQQPAFRVRDRAPASSEETMLDPNGKAPWFLADVDFRVDHTHHRVDLDEGRRRLHEALLPPNLDDTGLHAANCIAEMDYAGVDVALMHVELMLGRTSPTWPTASGATPIGSDRWRRSTNGGSGRIPTA